MDRLPDPQVVHVSTRVDPERFCGFAMVLPRCQRVESCQRSINARRRPYYVKTKQMVKVQFKLQRLVLLLLVRDCVNAVYYVPGINPRYFSEGDECVMIARACYYDSVSIF
jgi:hypothetical protein